jgi:four helix bundle protein
MDAPELRERTAAFAREVAKFVRPLIEQPVFRNAAQQLGKSSSSVAANCRAVTCGHTRAQFRTRICLTLEEADESVYWLQHLLEAGAGNRVTAVRLLREAKELAAIYGASRRTLMAELKQAEEPKRRTDGPGPPPRSAGKPPASEPSDGAS